MKKEEPETTDRANNLFHKITGKKWVGITEENLLMEKNQIDISVIVPVYNVEEYLEECLDSLLRQGNVNLEVIMIDDGSTDGSSDITRRYEEEFDNFHLHRIPNGGLGHARNYAVPFAVGKYITFLDSDDIIPDETYEKMFLLAEQNGSDLTICNFMRYTPQKTWSSGLQYKAFHNIEPVTHIKEHSNLIYDTTSCGKLILRSFYLKYDFCFPENVLYEDIPFSIRAHYLANRVSVLMECGYLWRVREGVSKSISQNTSNIENLYSRIKIMKILDDFFEKEVKEPWLVKKKQIRNLDLDLMLFVNVCQRIPKEQALENIRLIKEYIDEAIPKEAFDDLKIIDQQKYEYIRNENLPGLLRVLEYEKENYALAPVEEKDGSLFVKLPEEIFTVKSRNITKELVQFDPRYFIDNIKVDGKKIEIVAHLYRRRINIREYEEQKISAFLYNELTGSKIPLEVIPEENHELTDLYGMVTDPATGEETHYNYDGSGFGVLMDVDALDFNEKSIGYHQILIEYENRFSKGHVLLGWWPKELEEKYHRFTLLSGNHLFRMEFDLFHKVRILLRQEEVFAEELRLEEKKVICRLSHAADAVWAVQKGRKKRRMGEEGKDDFVAFETTDHIEFSAPIELFEKEKRYDVFLKKNQKENILISRSKKLSVKESDRIALIENTQLTYGLRMTLYDFVAVARITATEENDCLIKIFVRTGGNIETVVNAVSARLRIEDWRSGQAVVLDEKKCKLKNENICCTFSINFENEEVIRNLYQSVRDLFIEYVFEDGKTVKAPVYLKKRFRHIMLSEELKISCYRGVEGRIRLKFTQLWRKEEDSAEKRQSLVMKNYPLYRKEELNKKRILFESLCGKQYSGNPRAIYEYIDEYYPEYECIWSLNDARTPIKGNAKRVRRGSLEYYRYLATAKYFFTNAEFEDGFEKREGQILVQTMNGTPLKTIGLDVKENFETERARQQFLKNSADWDYLVVQGGFMEQKAKSCFGFENEILCTGYPRSDQLFKSDAQIRGQIKEKLELPKNKKIILYAPTWRVKNKFDMQMDLEKMREALGEDYILLVRLHHFSYLYYTVPADREFIFNFSSCQNTEELLMISDILITDYSSIVFDYALMNKPIIFFTYDLEEYCRKMRRLYADFEKEAPGPIVFTTEEVISAIRNQDQDKEKYKERLKKFGEKYLGYEQFGSSIKIVRKVIRPNLITHYVHRIKGLFSHNHP